MIPLPGHCCRCRVNAGLSCAGHSLEQMAFCDKHRSEMPNVLPDIPLELSGPDQTLDISDAVLTGGCFFMAAVAPSDHMAPVPCLVFRFTDSHGDFIRPIAL